MISPETRTRLHHALTPLLIAAAIIGAVVGLASYAMNATDFEPPARAAAAPERPRLLTMRSEDEQLLKLTREASRPYLAQHHPGFTPLGWVVSCPRTGLAVLTVEGRDAKGLRQTLTLNVVREGGKWVCSPFSPGAFVNQLELRDQADKRREDNMVAQAEAAARAEEPASEAE